MFTWLREPGRRDVHHKACDEMAGVGDAAMVAQQCPPSPPQSLSEQLVLLRLLEGSLLNHSHHSGWFGHAGAHLDSNPSMELSDAAPRAEARCPVMMCTQMVLAFLHISPQTRAAEAHLHPQDETFWFLHREVTENWS